MSGLVCLRMYTQHRHVTLGDSTKYTMRPPCGSHPIAYVLGVISVVSQPANRLDVYTVSLKICIEGHVAPRPRACGGPRRGRAPQSDRGPRAHKRTPKRREGRSSRTRLKSEIVRGVRRA